MTHRLEAWTLHVEQILPFRASSNCPSCMSLNPNTSASRKVVGFESSSDAAI
jgi:hypothetical protein